MATATIAVTKVARWRRRRWRRGAATAGDEEDSYGRAVSRPKNNNTTVLIPSGGTQKFKIQCPKTFFRNPGAITTRYHTSSVLTRVLTAVRRSLLLTASSVHQCFNCCSHGCKLVTPVFVGLILDWLFLLRATVAPAPLAWPSFESRPPDLTATIYDGNCRQGTVNYNELFPLNTATPPLQSPA